MRNRKFGLAILLFLGLLPGRAYADDYADTLSKCLVTSTTSDERVAMMKWFFAAMSLNPSVGSLINLSADQWQKISDDAGKVFADLIATRCREQSLNVLRYDRTEFAKSFRALGTLAGESLMTDPRVRAAIAAVGLSLVKDPRFISMASELKTASPK
jgi:hypothetical protein